MTGAFLAQTYPLSEALPLVSCEVLTSMATTKLPRPNACTMTVSLVNSGKGSLSATCLIASSSEGSALGPTDRMGPVGSLEVLGSAVRTGSVGSPGAAGEAVRVGPASRAGPDFGAALGSGASNWPPIFAIRFFNF